MGRLPYWPSWKVNYCYCTFRFGAIILRDLHILLLPRDSPRDLSPSGKGNLYLKKFLGGLTCRYEKFWRNNNSPPYVTARWLPHPIPPLNFLGGYIPSKGWRKSQYLSKKKKSKIIILLCFKSKYKIAYIFFSNELCKKVAKKYYNLEHFCCKISWCSGD